MDNGKIAFIVCTDNETYMNECRYYINSLYVPDGFKIQIIEMNNAVSMTSGYNTAMLKSDARYKIFLHQDTFLVNRNMLFELLKIFKDHSIGMIGLVGGEAYKDGDIHHYWNRGHVLNATYDEIIDVDMKDEDTDDPCISVDAVDGLFIATQYDIEWDERINKWHMYDVVQSIRFKNAGYRVCVLNTERTWALHDAGFCSEKGYDDARKKLAECYPDRFSYIPLDRELITDDMDSVYLDSLYDKISDIEDSKYGHRCIPDTLDEFTAIYNDVKFLIYRLSFGMPKNDWRRLIKYVLCKKISAAFLMEMISRYAVEPDNAATEFESAIDETDTTVMFFDQYQRYHTVAQLISQLKESFKTASSDIMEVGANEHKNLGKELRNDNILYTDLSIPEAYKYDNRYILANACHMPEIPNNSFDFCVALDVFEHIPPADRENFISELLRVCRNAAVICFPYRSEHTQAAEAQVNKFNRTITGDDNPWLTEHIKYGLPDRSTLEDHLHKKNISFLSFTHGGIDLWEKMTTLNTLIDNEEFNQEISDLNILYNRKVYSTDSTDRDYRAFYVLFKKPAACHAPVNENGGGCERTFADNLYNTVIQRFCP